MKKAIKLRLSLNGMDKENYRVLLIDKDDTFEDLLCYIWDVWGFTGEDTFKGFCELELKPLYRDEDDFFENYEKNICCPEYKEKVGEYNWENKKRIIYYYNNGIWRIDIEYLGEEEIEDELPKVIEGKGGKMIEYFEGVEEIKELLEIYEEKDDEKAREKGYADYDTLKWEIENVILKEIDWEKYNIKEDIKRLKEEDGIDLYKTVEEINKCY